MKIDSGSFNNAVSDLEENISKLSKQYDRLVSATEELKYVWETDKANEFRKQFKKYFLVSLDKMIQNLSAYYRYLNKVPDTFNTLDSSYAEDTIDV